MMKEGEAMKKKILWLFVTVGVILAVGVGTTLALLIASSQRVENTFTVGNVEITLTETTGDEYFLSPGVTLMKDPKVTVKANSEDCWIFVKLERSAEFDEFCTFQLADGWTPLSENGDVYYQKVEESSVNRIFKVLRNDRISVKDTVTEERLKEITVIPTLTITAYAVQSDGILTPRDAWSVLN